MFIPEIGETGETGWESKFSSRLNKIDSKISELEDRLKEQGKNVKRLAEALSSE